MIISGKFFYRGQVVEGCIVVEDGVIVDVRKDAPPSDEVVNFSKGIILPAGIDVHVHFRDFEESYKETIESGSLSALHGGICLVVDQPNTKPPVVDSETYLERIRRAEKTTFVDYALNLGLTEENARIVSEILKIVGDARVPAVGEVFLQHKSMQVSYETLKAVRSRIEGLITVHAEDPSLIPDESVRPKEAEITAVRRCLEFGEFYFCHISTLEALEMIHRSNSFAEVTPHHLLLSAGDVEFDRVNPPLRAESDRLELLRNFSKADVVASDHAPHTLEDKRDGAPGFPGVETLYPLMIELVRRGVISLRDLVERIVVNPAKIFGFKGYSGIEIGNYANLAVFDFSEVRRIKAEYLHSKAGWTPYEGFEAVFPKVVFIRGVKALEEGEVLVERGFGRSNLKSD